MKKIDIFLQLVVAAVVGYVILHVILFLVILAAAQSGYDYKISNLQVTTEKNDLDRTSVEAKIF